MIGQEYQEEQQQAEESYPQEAEAVPQVPASFIWANSVENTFKLIEYLHESHTLAGCNSIIEKDKTNNSHPLGVEGKRQPVCSKSSQPIPLKSSAWL